MKRIFAPNVCAEIIASGLALLASLGAHAQLTSASEFAGRMRTLVGQAQSYEHGEGIPKNTDTAHQLYCEAARQGWAEAQFKLGWMYANGRGVDRNNGIAAGFFRLAAEQGHEYAARMAGFMGRPSEWLPPCMSGPDPVSLVETAEASPMALQGALDMLVKSGVAKGNSLGGNGATQRADWSKTAAWRKPIVDAVRLLAPQYGIDSDFALAIIAIESAFDANARSPKNAQGLMQLIPETASRFGVKRAFDPIDNIKGGLGYLRWLMSHFRGRVEWVAAAYNAGEGAVAQHRGVPPYAETRRYVEKLCKLYPHVAHAFDASLASPSSLTQFTQTANPVANGCVLPATPTR